MAQDAHPQNCEQGEAVDMMPIYRVTLMSWCFQFLLDLLWIPLAAYFKDLQLGLSVLGVVFAANLGVRIVPNVLATRLGVKTDMACMVIGLAGFAVNLVFPQELWAILVMAAAGGFTFVRAHLSVHGKLAAGGSVHSLTLAARWSGAARNLGTMVAFVVPTAVYQSFGWRSVLVMAMCAMCLYLALAAKQHSSQSSEGEDSEAVSEASSEGGLVEDCTEESVPWIDWVIAGAFCATELQMNIQAAAVPTTLLELGVPMPLVGGVQAVGQLLAMGFLVLLSKGFCSCLQKRPFNLLVSFSGTFLGMAVLWAARAFEVEGAEYIIVLALYFFYASAYTAQVTMLECLTGVLDMENSIYVMGVSETIGCACSLVGGYLGPALLETNPAAPFALEAAIALITTLALGVGLGLRAWDQYVVCETKLEYEETVARDRAGSISKTVSGLKHIVRRRESHIGIEKSLRKIRTESTLSVVDSMQSLQTTDVITFHSMPDMPTAHGMPEVSTVHSEPDDSPTGPDVAEVVEPSGRSGRRASNVSFAPQTEIVEPSGSGGLAAPLLSHEKHSRRPSHASLASEKSSRHPTSRRPSLASLVSGMVSRKSSRRPSLASEDYGPRHRRMKSEPLAAPKVVMSTYQARQYKMAIVGFGMAPVGIDREDYVLEREDPERPVLLARSDPVGPHFRHFKAKSNAW